MTSSQPPAQVRSITLGGALSIVIGSMLGIGIFLSPGEMARVLPDATSFLGVWLVAGLIVLGGAIAYAELGVRYPQAGGDYVFHRKAFGPSVAFASGWALFGAIFAGSIAAVAVALFEFQVNALLPQAQLHAPLFELPLIGTVHRAQVAGVALVLGVTALNARGVRPAAWMQQLLTVLPVILLSTLALFALSSDLPALPAPADFTPPALSLSGLVSAYLAAYFAYSGWNAIIYVAGELREPQRSIPLALVGGTLGITTLYIALCAAFVAVLGLPLLAGGGEAGSQLAEALFGPVGHIPMNLLVLACLVATLNSSVLSGARLAYAMAQDGALWRRAARLSPRTGVPTAALWLQAAWASTLIFTNSFNALLIGVSLTMVLTGALTVLAWFRLEARVPAPRVVHFFGARALIWLFLASSALVLGVQLYDGLLGDGSFGPLWGLALTFAALVAHAAHSRSRASATKEAPPKPSLPPA